MLRSPFNYYGCKLRVADLVWKALGDDIPIYYEPFFGSGAVLLNRPNYDPVKHIEVVNDKDALLCNFWRAIQKDPEGVVSIFDRPVNHAELIAIRKYLEGKKEKLFENVTNDLSYYDVEIAGLWLYVINMSFSNAKHNLFSKTIPLLKNGGEGLFGRKYVSAELKNEKIQEFIKTLCIRLKNVRVVCGDWTVLCKNRWWTTLGGSKVAGFFLDPPYSNCVRTNKVDIYTVDSPTIYSEVLNWCKENGNNNKFRIVYACSNDDGDSLKDCGWSSFEWSNHYGRTMNKDKSAIQNKEKLWFSPYCLVNTNNTTIEQAELFDCCSNVESSGVEDGGC